MPHLENLVDSLRDALVNVGCPTYDNPAWVNAPAPGERRVAIISTAALQKRDEQSFELGDAEYRVIPGDLPTSELVMSHVSTNFDRTGFQQDVNVVFPVDRLRELAADGIIGSVSDYHYSFLGSTDPQDMAPAVERLAPLLKKDAVNTLLLAPV